MMNEFPRCLKSEVEFHYKQEVITALEAGASLRKDNRQLVASDLLGTYQIRLNIANDFSNQKSNEPITLQYIQALTELVKNLGSNPTENVAAWYVRLSDGDRYWLFENEKSGLAFGCLHSETSENVPA